MHAHTAAAVAVAVCEALRQHGYITRIPDALCRRGEAAVILRVIPRPLAGAAASRGIGPHREQHGGDGRQKCDAHGLSPAEYSSIIFHSRYLPAGNIRKREIAFINAADGRVQFFRLIHSSTPSVSR